MELQVNQSLQAQPPHFDLLPDLMLADVATEVDFDRPCIVLMAGGGCQGASARALRHSRRIDRLCRQVLLLENE